MHVLQLLYLNLHKVVLCEYVHMPDLLSLLIVLVHILIIVHNVIIT